MNLKPSLMRALDLMNGRPQTTQALVDTMRLVHPGTPAADVLRDIRRLESAGLVSGAYNPLLETDTWTLTEKGRHAVCAL